jgi:hypothetical protein
LCDTTSLPSHSHSALPRLSFADIAR